MKKTLIDKLGWTQGTLIFKMLFSQASINPLDIVCLAAPANTFSCNANCAHLKITIIFFQHSPNLTVLKIRIITLRLCASKSAAFLCPP